MIRIRMGTRMISVAYSYNKIKHNHQFEPFPEYSGGCGCLWALHYSKSEGQFGQSALRRVYRRLRVCLCPASYLLSVPLISRQSGVREDRSLNLELFSNQNVESIDRCIRLVIHSLEGSTESGPSSPNAAEDRISCEANNAKAWMGTTCTF